MEKTFTCEVNYSDLNWTQISIKSPKTGYILRLNQGWFPNQYDSATEQTTPFGSLFKKVLKAHNDATYVDGKVHLSAKYTADLTVDELAAFKAAVDRQDAKRAARK